MEEERLQEEREEEEEEEEGLGRTEDERQEAPLMGNIVSNHETNHHHQPATKAQRDSGSIEPWAHRDLKPANVLISDDDQPILMDFGSAIKARIPVPNRSIALQQQDLAAEHSSMPYEPLIFDVKTGEDLTEAVDIWSLGCVLYCLGYGHSPFETTDTVEQGGLWL
ncbi:hypothetical protein KEM48_002772 [Puccinia striiformis f. sp. tritici PST-130]|nr:hypothetical protein KEM48_002772 [Puccinia striiformis f. sp. tritici PST-130]